MGDVARARYLREVNKIVSYVAAETGRDGSEHFMVRAKLAVLNKEFKLAESIFMEQVTITLTVATITSVLTSGFCLLQGHVNEAMEMYQELHMWDESIGVAEAAVSYPIDFVCCEFVRLCLIVGPS